MDRYTNEQTKDHVQTNDREVINITVNVRLPHENKLVDIDQLQYSELTHFLFSS